MSKRKRRHLSAKFKTRIAREAMITPNHSKRIEQAVDKFSFLTKSLVFNNLALIQKG